MLGLPHALNAGGTGNLAGFAISDEGALTPLANSTQALSSPAAAAAPVQFSNDGALLAVTERATNRIDVFPVEGGVAAAGVVSPASGVTAFGFGFDNRGRLIVSEAFAGTPLGSAASSYDIAENGSLSVISGSLATHQTAACWLVVTRNGKYAYTGNAGSPSISGYRIAADGRLSLLDASGVSGSTGATGVTHLAVSSNSHFLYALNGRSATINAFRVEQDGSLLPITGVTGVPGTAVGLAAL